MKVCVIAPSVDVKASPSRDAAPIGQLTLGESVRILNKQDNWVQILQAHEPAWIPDNYILPEDKHGKWQATVTASQLRIRAAPELKSPIIGLLSLGTTITVRFISNGWARINTDMGTGYLSMQYLDFEGSDSHRPQLSAYDQSMSQTLSQVGDLLPELCEKHQLEQCKAAAVMCVESSGAGFSDTNEGRMVIRFENHKFKKYWHSDNSNIFDNHFTYRPDKPWKDHQWRRHPSDPWQSFHGSQKREWEVFEFARSLDDTAAMMSISMGAPQIMGFNYKQLGYKTVQEMFASFASGIEYQARGFFNFLSPSMLECLNNNDYTGFAAMYNGSGQKERYGSLIKEHIDAYHRMHS